MLIQRDRSVILFLLITFFCVEAEKVKISSLERLCVLKSDINHTLIFVFYPEKFQALEMRCCADLKSLKINSETRFNLLSRNCKTKNPRKTPHPSSTVRVPLVDEYQLKTPFLWKLKCPQELKHVISYLKQKFTELEIAPIPEVPLLIALDYGSQGDTKACLSSKAEVNFDFGNDCLTKEEGLFLQKYFNIQAEKQAHLFFAFYHRMSFQLEKIKYQSHNQGAVISEIWTFIKSSLKELGLLEVLYRIFLIKLILLLGHHGGKRFQKWVLSGANRGTSHHDVVHADDCADSGSTTSTEPIHSACSGDDDDDDDEPKSPALPAGKGPKSKVSIPAPAHIVKRSVDPGNGSVDLKRRRR